MEGWAESKGDGGWGGGGGGRGKVEVEMEVWGCQKGQKALFIFSSKF